MISFKTSLFRQGCELKYTPDVDGRIPVIMEAREGLHAGAGQKARENTTLSEARASSRGVFASGCPPRKPVQSFISSIQIKSIFGWSFLLFRHPDSAARKAIRRGSIDFIFIAYLGNDRIFPLDRLKKANDHQSCNANIFPFVTAAH
jgi:hypothetical protein